MTHICVKDEGAHFNPLYANLNYGALTGGDEINQLNSTVPCEHFERVGKLQQGRNIEDSS